MNGQVFDILLISPFDGAPLINWDWWGGDHQKFYLDAAGGDTFRIRMKHTGKCLFGDGASLTQFPCDGGDRQRYRFVPEVPPPPPSYQLSGQLISAFTGQPLTGAALTGATVSFVSGTTTVNANVGADSRYTASLPQGQYTGTAKATDYVPATVNFAMGAADQAQNFNMSPVDRNVRFVLSWNAIPKDMDLYLINTNTNQVANFRNKSVGFMKFDVDKSSGLGPETITLSPGSTDRYRLVVRRYSKEVPISASGSKIDVYREGQLIKSVSIPTNAVPIDWVMWDVLYNNAANGQLELVNTVNHK
jgi:hypothetical protein